MNRFCFLMALIFIILISRPVRTDELEIQRAYQNAKSAFEGRVTIIERFDLDQNELLDRRVRYKQLGEKLLVEYEYCNGGTKGVMAFTSDWTFRLIFKDNRWQIGGYAKTIVDSPPVDLLQIAEPVTLVSLLRREPAHVWLKKDSVTSQTIRKPTGGLELSWRQRNADGSGLLAGTELFSKAKGGSSIRLEKSELMYLPTNSITTIVPEYEGEGLKSVIYAQSAAGGSSGFTYRYEIRTLDENVTAQDFKLSAYGLSDSTGQPQTNWTWLMFFALVISGSAMWFLWHRK
jgi:hypothetical protein